MSAASNASRPTLDQRRAAHAWQAIQRLGEVKKEEAGDYAGEAKKLPMRIMAAGLGHALAFLHAKATDKKKGLEHLLKDLSDWVIVKRPLPAKTSDLMQSIIEGDARFLRRATDETLAYLQWLNRFAEAEGLGEGTD